MTFSRDCIRPRSLFHDYYFTFVSEMRRKIASKSVCMYNWKKRKKKKQRFETKWTTCSWLPRDYTSAHNRYLTFDSKHVCTEVMVDEEDRSMTRPRVPAARAFDRLEGRKYGDEGCLSTTCTRSLVVVTESTGGYDHVALSVPSFLPSLISSTKERKKKKK